MWQEPDALSKHLDSADCDIFVPKITIGCTLGSELWKRRPVDTPGLEFLHGGAPRMFYACPPFYSHAVDELIIRQARLINDCHHLHPFWSSAFYDCLAKSIFRCLKKLWGNYSRLVALGYKQAGGHSLHCQAIRQWCFQREYLTKVYETSLSRFISCDQ